MTEVEARENLPNRPESVVERAFTDRPSISIRLRIGISVAAYFLLMVGVTVAWIVSVSEVGASQAFLERANRYVFEIEQARRFEKNYLLYHTNLDEALNHVGAAHRLLVDMEGNAGNLVGTQAVAAIEQNLFAYERLLEQLSPGAEATSGVPQRAALERGLRMTGAKALEDASGLMDKERLRMHTIIRSSKVVALMGLAVVFLVLVYVAGNLARQILAPLGRFVSYTQRIADGDYSPIVPTRRFKDEFSDLALAINRMLGEIKDHQAQLARSSRMAAVGTLTAGIAHELNNPLNNISLTTEAILEGQDDYTREEREKMLKDIFTQVERASATVRNLLDFTRVEKPVFVPVALGDVIHECMNLVSNEARISGVQCGVEVPSNPLRVHGNPRNLQQVFLNLFLNAIQAMPRGGTLTVTAYEVTEHAVDAGMIRVDVADTGVGIPEENLPSIFDPFFTTKDVGTGTGLGLSVSYGIVQAHHGRLEVRSDLETGTVFSVYLPRLRDEASTLSS